MFTSEGTYASSWRRTTELVVDEHVSGRGLRTLCVREVLKSLNESAKLLIEDKIRSLGVGHLFEIQKDMSAFDPKRTFATASQKHLASSGV